MPGSTSWTTRWPASIDPSHPPRSTWDGPREIQTKHHDLRIGIVDATVIALAERLGEDKVATLDRRHFATVRPAHVTALRSLP